MAGITSLHQGTGWAREGGRWGPGCAAGGDPVLGCVVARDGRSLMWDATNEERTGPILQK